MPRCRSATLVDPRDLGTVERNATCYLRFAANPIETAVGSNGVASNDPVTSIATTPEGRSTGRTHGRVSAEQNRNATKANVPATRSLVETVIATSPESATNISPLVPWSFRRL